MADVRSRVQDFIDMWGKKVQQSAADVLTKTVGYTGGQAPDITETMRTNVSVNGDTVTWALSMDGYWQFIEFGVDGTEKSHGSKFKFKNNKPVPQAAVEKFITTRHITLKSLKAYGRKNKTIESRGLSLKSRSKVRKSLKGLDREAERKTLTYILGRSIKKYGIRPRPFREDIITKELKAELLTGLAKIYKEDFIANIKLD